MNRILFHSSGLARQANFPSQETCAGTSGVDSTPSGPFQFSTTIGRIQSAALDFRGHLKKLSLVLLTPVITKKLQDGASIRTNNP